jgi:hypothetical protein
VAVLADSRFAGHRFNLLLSAAPELRRATTATAALNHPTHLALDSSHYAMRPLSDRIEERKLRISVRSRRKQEVCFAATKKTLLREE